MKPVVLADTRDILRSMEHRRYEGPRPSGWCGPPRVVGEAAADAGVSNGRIVRAAVLLNEDQLRELDRGDEWHRRVCASGILTKMQHFVGEGFQ